MLINFTTNSAIRGALISVIGFCLFQVAVRAQSPPETETIVKGRSFVIGLVSGEVLRYSAFNPSETDADKPTEPLSLQLKLYDAHGSLIATSPKLVIPPGEFRWIEFDRDSLPISGEPGSTRAQFRTQPLWGLRAKDRLQVSTSLEIHGNTSATPGTFRFFFNVEALP